MSRSGEATGSEETSWESTSSTVAVLTASAATAALNDAARRCFIICVATTRCDVCQRPLKAARRQTFCLGCMNMGYEDLDGGSSGGSGGGSTKTLIVWVIIAKVFAILSVVLVAVWFGVYEGGFSWSEKQFNFHPLFMTIGLIYLFGDAIMVYRVLPGVKRQTVKLIHLILNLIALVFVVLGLHCVFSLNGPTLYSLHAWIGITTVVCFALQWVGGLIAFITPWVSGKRKGAYKPVHVFWGIALFGMAAAAVLTGAMEEIKNTIASADYSSYTGEGLLANSFGIIVLATVISTTYIIVNPEFKKGFKQEEERIPIN